MKTAALLLLLGLSALRSASAAIDFTPIPTEFVLVGIKARLLNFQHDGRTISYGPPNGWTYTGTADGIKFTPPDLAQAQATIEQSPVKGAPGFDEEGIKALQAATMAAVPPDSRNVSVVSEEKSPLRLGNNDTYAVTIAYEAFGQEFMTSVLYVNLPDVQLRFRTTARKADFEKVHKAFRGSAFSWHWKAPPTAETSPALAAQP